MVDNIQEDGELIRRIMEGNTHLFANIIGKYERLMYSFLLPQVKSFQEVQDIAQEAFIKAYRHLASFDRSRRFSAWLLKIARNLLIDRMRKNAEILHSDNSSVQEIIDKRSAPLESSEPGRIIESQEEFKKTFLNMIRLPEELRIPLLLRVLQELSYDEIAEILDLPVQTVKNRIFKARQTLRNKRDAENAM